MSSTQTEEEIDSLFPEDPTTPSLALIASNNVQITLPYSTGGKDHPIFTLGSGCRPAKIEGRDAPAAFTAQTALSDRTLKEGIYFRIENGAQSKFHKAITSDSHASSEHLSLSGKVSAGGKFAEASDMKASIQASIRTGNIYIDEPRFSLAALADTRRTRTKPSCFPSKYGEYYVASLKLGADAGVLASSASTLHDDSESLDVKAKLRVLWWDIEASEHEETHSVEAWAEFKATGFDTLAGENVGGGSRKQTGEVIMDFVERVTDVEARVRGKMEEFGLTEDKKVDLEMCRRLCEAGLVVEITLLPYSQVRDYMVALNQRR
ncbi:hypothetical protein ASPWEDRAFT_28171 [Aspergillus wentii DTO 134E9]|uniref:Uncharacterized protein n=1 Tax=Aspergillus wentii DTO 134E9 TaxID=1073089 RepID=A0A1L9RKT6_ASPWE|nr:uncharacterized protein ASPWEDRAFT_28171 [Aspergillus wentii DTO 134E9]OJJ35545.1 hypothetical protein ASPWEDRAFT_28171 [Aspergillus wentii DTO 134E9]